MSLLSERLKTRTERTALALADSDLLALQTIASSEWFKVQIGTIKEAIGNPSVIADTALLSLDLQIYKDPTDSDPTDGINMIVRNTVAATIQWRSNGTWYSILSPATITLNTPDLTYSRIDLIYLSSIGTIEKSTGVADEFPVKPAIPAYAVPLSFVLVDVNGDTTITSLISVDIVQVVHDYTIKATDINQDTINIGLFYEIRENFNVYVFINGLMLNYNKGYSYVEGTNIVTIDFLNTNDFKYKPQIGWPIQVYYTIKNAVAVVNTDISLTSILVDIIPEWDDLTFQLWFHNSNMYAVDVPLNLRLTNSAGTIIFETDMNYNAATGSSIYYVPVFQDLAPDTYTLTVTGATAQLSGSESETIVQNVATYDEMYDALRGTDTTVIAQVAVTNTNAIGGNVVRKVAIDAGTKTAYNKYIEPNATGIYQHEFTGVSSAAHTVDYYDEFDNLIYTINIAALSITEFILSGANFLGRLIYHWEGTTDYYDLSFKNFNPGTAGLYFINPSEAICRNGLRIPIPSIITGITEIKLYLTGSAYELLKSDLTKLEIYEYSGNLQTDPTITVYEGATGVNLVQSVTLSTFTNSGGGINDLLEITLNSNAFTLFENQIDERVDLMLMSGDESDYYTFSWAFEYLQRIEIKYS